MSNAFAMLSLCYLPLAEFTAIAAMTPLAMTLIAALWLHQPVSPLRWVLVTLGFAGQRSFHCAQALYGPCYRC